MRRLLLWVLCATIDWERVYRQGRYAPQLGWRWVRVGEGERRAVGWAAVAEAAWE